MHWGIVLVEHPVPVHHHCPLLLEDLHLAQGLRNVTPIYCGPHGRKVCVNQAFVIEEALGPFDGPGQMILGLHWTRLNLWQPLSRLLFSFRSVKRYGGFVQSDNIVEDGH